MSAELAGAAVLIALVAYGLTGGADFGGGVWDLLARGRHKARIRGAVQAAIGPIWEANHVWLIFAIVLLFTAFPVAFAAIMTALHVPLLLILLGIIARGTAFVMRKHDPGHARQWTQVFGWASLASPVVTSPSWTRTSPVESAASVMPRTTGLLDGWATPYAFAVGLLALALFAFLAAVYLVVDARQEQDVQEAFRSRALQSLGVLAILGAGVLWWSRTEAPVIWDGLTRQAAWLLVLAALAGATCLQRLLAAQTRFLRPAAATLGGAMLMGWGVAQAPHLIVPDVTLQNAASDATGVIVWMTAAGMVFLLPSLSLIHI